MPEFQLDTSGTVDNGPAVAGAPFGLRWPDLDAFTQGYIEALFFTETANGIAPGRMAWEPGGRGTATEYKEVGFADLAPEALAAIIADCRKFQIEFRQIAENAGADLVEGWPDDDSTCAGRDFLYTRNGHGCGFWDGDWPEPYASELDKAAKAFPEIDAYLGDDGKVYLS